DGDPDIAPLAEEEVGEDARRVSGREYGSVPDERLERHGDGGDVERRRRRPYGNLAEPRQVVGAPQGRGAGKGKDGEGKQAAHPLNLGRARRRANWKTAPIFRVAPASRRESSVSPVNHGQANTSHLGGALRNRSRGADAQVQRVGVHRPAAGAL